MLLSVPQIVMEVRITFKERFLVMQVITSDGCLARPVILVDIVICGVGIAQAQTPALIVVQIQVQVIIALVATQTLRCILILGSAKHVLSLRQSGIIHWKEVNAKHAL